MCGVAQVLSLLCRGLPVWMSSRLGIGEVRQTSSSHVIPRTLAEDDCSQQQVHGYVTPDVTRCWTTDTELHDRLPSPIVDEKPDSKDVARCDLTAI